MSISNYIPSKECSYKYDKLKDVVYLVTKDHLKDIHIDNGDAYIINLDEAPLMVECTSVEFSEQESLDERYKFTKTLRFTVNGYANVNSLEGGCYGIIVAADGTTFMTNVDFPAKVTFTYNLTNKRNQTEFTLSSQSNYPTLRLNANLTSSSKKCKVYAEYGVESLNFIEKDYVTLNDRTGVITLFGGRKFKTVEFLKNACTLQETWDGEKAIDVLSFDIAFDDYKSSWQYNILEFMDNLYAGMVKPKSDTNAFFVGFNFGLRPSYEISTTTEDGSSNKITITMREESMHGMYTLENPSIVENSDVTWRYVENVGNYATYECIDYNTAIYLAMEEIDIHNNPTGRYMVLEGYENQYSQLFNVVDTFNERVIFYTTKCSWFPSCKMIGNMPSPIVFANGLECKDYTFGSRCNWHFENMPNYLIFNRTSGYADTEYSLQICNTLHTDVIVTSDFDIVHGNHRDSIEVKIIPYSKKLVATYLDDSVYNLPCESTSNTLTSAEVKVSTVAPYYTMKNAVIGLCVEIIEVEAFKSLYYLENVSIPNSVKEISYSVFSNDTSLANVVLPNSLIRIRDNAFYGCTSLSSIDIPDSVIYMGEFVFSGCTSLSAATLSTGMTEVPLGTFQNCTNLGYIIVPSNYTHVRGLAFEGCSSMTSAEISHVSYFGTQSFRGCTSLQSATLTSAITIGDEAFANCRSLSSVTFGDNLDVIGNYSFHNCSGLTSVTIPSGVSDVGNGAFSGCSRLNEIYLLPYTPPGGGIYAFDDTNNCPIYVHCSSLNAYQTTGSWSRYAKRYVAIENSCPIKFDGRYMDGTTFKLGCNGASALTQSEVDLGGNNGMLTAATVDSCYNALKAIGSNAFNGETNLISISLANSITKFEVNSFCGCISLTNTNFFPSSLQIIDNSAFSGCTSIEQVTFPNNVTTLGNNIFKDCTSITGITWGNSMTYVGVNDFYNCTSLSSVSFANTNITNINSSAFKYCTSLSSINLGNVTTVGDLAFQYCTSLSNINFGNVTTIGEVAFGNCTSLSNVTIPNIVTSLGGSAFEFCTNLKSVVIGSGITNINYSTFKSCSSLSSVTMTDNVTSIGSSAFTNCTSLSSITLSNNLTSIDSFAFYNDALRTITIPSGVTTIGDSAFRSCTNLESVWMKPITPPTIGSRAFYNTNNCPIYVPCCSLGAYQIAWSEYATRLVGYAYEECDECPTKLVLTYNDSTTFIFYCDSTNAITSAETKGDRVFEEDYMAIERAEIGSCVTDISATTFMDCTGLTSCTIGSGVTGIGNSAFTNCESLPNIVIPNNVTYIGKYAFSGDTSLSSVTLSQSLTEINIGLFQDCTSLTGITLGNNIETISHDAFWNCTNITGVTIPSSVRIIGGQSFYDCTGLTGVTVESLTPPSLGISAFTFSSSDATYPIYVHCCAIGAYQKAYIWNLYRNRLRPIETPCIPKVEATYYGGTQSEEIGRVYCSDCNSANGESVTQTEIRSVLPSTLPEYAQYSAITDVNISGCATSIGDFAFDSCSRLSSVTMTNGVEDIGACSFQYCTSLLDVELSNAIISIGAQAFRHCISLSGITLPDTLVSIGYGAFERCTALEGAFPIPSDVTDIGWGAFKDCIRITSFNIPSGVTVINNSTFENCVQLRNITLPNTVTFIGNDAFRLCVELSGITIPDSVTEIGSAAFEGCEKLTTIHIPSGVRRIGDSAFNGCSGMTDVWLYSETPPVLNGDSVFDNLSPNGYTIHVPCYSTYSTAEYWDEYAGHMVEYGSGCHEALLMTYTDQSEYNIMCGDITDNSLTRNDVQSGSKSFTLISGVSIGDCITSIGNNAFSGCTNLVNVDIPSGVTTIGDSAFRSCNNLTHVTFESGITSLGNYVFRNCPFLESVVIPNTITNIGQYAFYNCLSIGSVTIQATTPPTIGSRVFDETNRCRIYVPAASVDLYKSTSGWSTYSSRIRAIQ